MAAAEFQWDDEEFDDSFFQEVDKLEELATSLTQNPYLPKPSSSSASFYPPPPPPPLPQQHPQLQPQPFIAGASVNDVSYSPPRELSQRFPPPNDSNNSHSSGSARFPQSPVTQEQVEIEKLKSELSQVSKQLSDLKQECSELRKERDKNKQLKSVQSNREASTWNSEAVIRDHPTNGISLRSENAAGHVNSRVGIEHKSIGIQTEKDDESAAASTSGATSTSYGNPELLSIWSSRNGNRSRRNFVAKLLETCTTDFCFLFRCFNPNMTSKVEIEHLNLVARPGNVQGLQSAEVARASQLYSVLAKLSNDMVHVDALLDALVDLCSLENELQGRHLGGCVMFGIGATVFASSVALVAHRSLHILHVALDHLLSMGRHHPKSVLCSGIISRWRAITLRQMLIRIMIRQ